MNTNISVMIAALFVFIPLTIISLVVQVSAIEEASNFSQSISSSGMHAKTTGIHILTRNDEISGTYTSSEFEEYFSNCGRDIPIVRENNLKVKTSENGCQIPLISQEGFLRLGVQVVRGGEVHNEKILVGYQ